MTYVLTMIDGSYHLITRQQAEVISDAKNAKKIQCLWLEDQNIVLNQVSGIYTMDVFRRNMKHKLSVKGLRLCRRCHSIVARNERCPCDDKPEKFPDILETVRSENPKLAAQLDTIAAAKQLPPAK